MALSWLGFGPSLKIDISLSDEQERKCVILPAKGEKVPLFSGADDRVVRGTVSLTPSSNKRLEHGGVKIELLGQIELFYDRGNHYEFLNVHRELLPPGAIEAAATFDFSFDDLDKQYESYNGVNARLRYFLRVTVVRSLVGNLVEEKDLWVFVHPEPPTVNNSIKMEVGIEDVLHIEFEYAKSKFHLKDVVIGKVYFLLVRLRIKSMEVGLIKRESCGSGPNLYNESDTLTKFEIMDGDPVRGESIPVRLFLAGFDLTPTMRNVANKFSVKYYLNLVLTDEEDRRYFKQQEITIYRRASGTAKGVATTKIGSGKTELAAYSGAREAEAEEKRRAREAATKEAVAAKREERARKAAEAAEKAEREAAEARAAGHTVPADDGDSDESSSGSYETDSDEGSDEGSDSDSDSEPVSTATSTPSKKGKAVSADQAPIPVTKDKGKAGKAGKGGKGKGKKEPTAAPAAATVNEYGEDEDGL